MDYLRLALVLTCLIIQGYIARWIIKNPKITRVKFSLYYSLSLGFLLFIVPLIFSNLITEVNPFYISIFLGVGNLILAFPISYILEPWLRKLFSKKQKTKQDDKVI